MNKTINKILSAIVLLALTLGSYVSVGASSSNAPLAAVTTYYVSTSGNDGSAGTSAAPFKTIQKCANIANSGNVCSVAAGTYAERVSVSRSGITFQANGTVTMQGFTITGNSNVVSGFYVLNSTHAEGGIVIKGSNNIVRNNKIERATLVGIQVQGNNLLVENNEVLATQARNSSDADGIRFFGDGNVIRGNYIHDLTYGSGESAVNAHIDCFQTWATDSKGIATNTLIEGNTCVNMQYINSSLKGQGFMLDGSNKASNITIRNNVIRAHQTYILNISGLKIENNTFEMYLTSSVILQNDANATVKNNLFYRNTTGSVGANIAKCCTYIQPTVIDWNWAYHTSGKYYTGSEEAIPANKRGMNPLFVNPAAGNFRLQANSPACTAGQNGGYVGAFPCGAPAPTTVPNTPTVVASVTPTVIMPTATKTSVAPTVTPTGIIPTATKTSVAPTVIVPTATKTSVAPTASAIPASPIPATATKIPASPVPATATAQQSPPTSETVYDDKHGNFVYSSDWRDVSIASAYGSSFKKTTEGGSQVTFTFTGQSFSVLFTAGPKFGRVDVYVDGVYVGKIGENSKATAYQKRWDYPGQLTLGTHTLKLVVVGEGYPNGSLDAVIVR